MSRSASPVAVPAVFGLLAALALAACGGGDGGGGADALPLGEEAAVGYFDGTDVRTTLGITVLGVRQGTVAELEAGGFTLDPDEQDMQVYYVDARYANDGDQTIERTVSVGLEDSDGNLIGSTLIFDLGGQPFEPCANVNEGALASGESFEDCTLFLVPEGTEVGSVYYLSDNGPDEEPEFVYWDAD